MADVQANLTDVIREEIVEFLHSEDCLDEARHLEKVFNYLSLIDEKFRDIDEELKERRRKIVDLQVELGKAAQSAMADHTEGIKLFD